MSLILNFALCYLVRTCKFLPLNKKHLDSENEIIVFSSIKLLLENGIVVAQTKKHKNLMMMGRPTLAQQDSSMLIVLVTLSKKRKLSTIQYSRIYYFYYISSTSSKDLFPNRWLARNCNCRHFA